MPLARTTALCLAVIAGGCAAAMPGYSPPNPKAEKFKASAPKGGGFAEDGSYYMTEQEEKLDCKQLAGSIKIKILQIREASGRVAPSGVAQNSRTALQTIKGGGSTYGRDLSEDEKRDRARLQTLNGRLVSKSCKSYDLDAELAPGNSKPPEPTVAASPKS